MRRTPTGDILANGTALFGGYQNGFAMTTTGLKGWGGNGFAEIDGSGQTLKLTPVDTHTFCP